MQSTRDCRKRISAKFWICVLCSMAPCLGGATTAQSPTTEFTGMWTATVGNGPAMRGMWLAQVSKVSANSARGSWSLLNESGQVVMQGSWTARKTGRDWQGSWTARVRNGRALSGTWSAALGDFQGSTLQEMLALTMEKQIGGSWQGGRYQGNWWLEGSGKKKRR